MTEEKRIALNDFKITPEVMAEAQKMVMERIQNIGLLASKKIDPISALLSELVMLEIKCDAALHLLDLHEVDFKDFDKMMILSAKKGVEGALNARQMIQAGPIIKK